MGIKRRHSQRELSDNTWKLDKVLRVCHLSLRFNSLEKSVSLSRINMKIDGSTYD